MPFPLQADDELTNVICVTNRMGVLCGECSGSYAPSINDDAYSCVPCDSSQVIGNIFKYIGIVYVPLVLFLLASSSSMFSSCTAGHANAYYLDMILLPPLVRTIVGSQLHKFLG